MLKITKTPPPVLLSLHNEGGTRPALGGTILKNFEALIWTQPVLKIHVKASS